MLGMPRYKKNWARIQKRSYDLGKFSVTNCVRFPSDFKIHLLYNFQTLLELLGTTIVFAVCISTSKMTSAMSNKKCKV
jgi:hypothetical protein